MEVLRMTYVVSSRIHRIAREPNPFISGTGPNGSGEGVVSFDSARYAGWHEFSACAHEPRDILRPAHLCPGALAWTRPRKSPGVYTVLLQGQPCVPGNQPCVRRIACRDRGDYAAVLRADGAVRDGPERCEDGP